MENKMLIELLVKASKEFAPGRPGPGGKPEGGPKGPGPAGPGAGGPPPEKKFLLMLNMMKPDQPLGPIAMTCGLFGPKMKEIVADFEEKGLVTTKCEDPDNPRSTTISITDAGKEMLEKERKEMGEKMKAAREKHIQMCDEKLSVYTEEEKETLAALLAKLVQ